jgi:hypothetical protein
MKTTVILCLMAVNALAAQPVLVRVTAQTLADLQKRDPMIRLVQPKADEVKVARPVNQSIVKESTILHDGRNWTMVPNGAVVHLPESMKSHVNVKPVGTLLPWADFLAKNQSWITTDEVSFDQAAGNEELPAERAISWTKHDKIVVAVHQHGPISVRVEDKSLTQR